LDVLDRIASRQGSRDDAPNQDLARALAADADVAGIGRIAENLRNEDESVKSDCIKVLYEIGYISPGLIAAFADEFLNLIMGKNNRMVWGGMIALGTIAHLRADKIYGRLPIIRKVMAKGSVITVDNGVKILATVAGAKPEYCDVIFPYLVEHLRSCRQKEVPQHAEKVLAAVNGRNWRDFVEIVESRMKEATDGQRKRLKKVMDKAAKRAGE
jgi:hypothetical protein